MIILLKIFNWLLTQHVDKEVKTENDNRSTRAVCKFCKFVKQSSMLWYIFTSIVPGSRTSLSQAKTTKQLERESILLSRINFASCFRFSDLKYKRRPSGTPGYAP